MTPSPLRLVTLVVVVQALSLAGAASAQSPSVSPSERPDTPSALSSLPATPIGMVARGLIEAFRQIDEVNATLPDGQISSEQIEDTMALLSDMGINVVEDDINLQRGAGANVVTVSAKTDEAWVEVVDDWQWMAGGREFLWVSERDGWAGRVFPWEYVIAAATRRHRRLGERHFTVSKTSFGTDGDGDRVGKFSQRVEGLAAGVGDQAEACGGFEKLFQ